MIKSLKDKTRQKGKLEGEVEGKKWRGMVETARRRNEQSRTGQEAKK